MANTPKETRKERDNLSYLRRLWRVSGGEEIHRLEETPAWLVSLQSARTADPVGLASLQELFDHLRAETGVSDGSR